MSHKNLNTSVTIPLSLIIVAALLPYLLPPIEIVEKTLTSYLQHKWLVWVLKSLVLSLVILSPYYLYPLIINPLNKKEKDILLKSIRDMVNTQYSLHRKNVLAKKFNELLNKEAARGFNLPTGTFAGVISDLYVSDISVFSKLLEDAIFKAVSKIKNKTLHEDLSVLINEALTKQNSDIKVLFSSFIKSYYQKTEQEHINAMNTNFALQADTETKQRIKYLLSVNNLEKYT